MFLTNIEQSFDNPWGSNMFLSGMIVTSLFTLEVEVLAAVLLPLYEALTGRCRCPGGLAIAVLLPFGLIAGFLFFPAMSIPIFSVMCARYGTLP